MKPEGQDRALPPQPSTVSPLLLLSPLGLGPAPKEPVLSQPRMQSCLLEVCGQKHAVPTENP